MIRPIGFLKKFLQTQMSGLTGHIEEARYPFDTVEWGRKEYFANNENPNWWVYEQTAYWLDGFLRCAILLDDKKAIQRAATIIYNVLNDADKDGYLGPVQLKSPDSFNRWPHVVFFRACMALYEYNGDKTIIEKLSGHYLGSPAVYVQNRNVLNVEIMLWLYEKTGDERLLQFAEQSYIAYNALCRDDLCDGVALSDKKPYAHGVSYNEYSKLGAILYRYTGKKEYLDASVAAYKKIDKYFMLPDGLHCSDEFMISNGVMHSHETCCVSDYTWSLNYLYEASKTPYYLDKIEKCVFNAGLGSVTDDFKALQYFSCVNQIVLDNKSNHNSFYRGSSWMSYRPNPGTECCPGNVNRFMPNYIMNMWSAEGSDVYLKLYGASEYILDGVAITEETEYPFNNQVKLKIKCERPFDLHLRIPVWAEGYEVVFSGEKATRNKEGFLTLCITENCEVLISFACGVKVHREKNYVWFSKGALVYSYDPECIVNVDESETRSSKEFPAYNIYAKNEWAFGVYEDCKVKDNNDGTLSLEVYKISNWKTETVKKVRRCTNLYERSYDYVDGQFTFTPPLPSFPVKYGDKKTVKLVPYGKTLCRITAFPRIR